jgi:hypothetical protein
MIFSGIQLCEIAFERLKRGEAKIPAHNDIPAHKITAGIVSVEAGFDRGYLKKSRIAHQSLIAQIELSRNSNLNDNEIAHSQLSTLKQKIDLLESDLKIKKKLLDNVLTQNLMLVDKMRELETKLKKYENKS